MRGDLCLKISAGGDEMPSNWNIGDVWAGRDQGPGWARTLESDKADVSREMLVLCLRWGMLQKVPSEGS